MFNAKDNPILLDAGNGLCPICKKPVAECAVIEYQEFYTYQVPVCGTHPQPKPIPGANRLKGLL